MSINALAKQLLRGDITASEYKQHIKRITTEENIPLIVKSLYTLEFGYPSLKVISNTTGISENLVKNALLDNSAYTRFIRPTHIENFRFVTSNFVDEIWNADLSEWGANNRMYSKQMVQNDGYVYILHIIDLFSRYVWLFPLKDKEGKTVADCFMSLAKDGLIPRKLWIDRGKEFYNKSMDYYCNKYGVERYSTDTNRKSAVAERNIRSIREIIFKYFEDRNTQRWIDILDKVADVYNNRHHRLLNMSPTQAREPENFNEVYSIMSQGGDDWDDGIDEQPKYEVGDKVRTRVMQGRFDKGTKPKFSSSIHTITSIGFDGTHYYRLDNDDDNFYYPEELFKVM